MVKRKHMDSVCVGGGRGGGGGRWELGRWVEGLIESKGESGFFVDSIRTSLTVMRVWVGAGGMIGEHVCVSLCRCGCVYVCVCVCVCVYVCVCVCVYVCMYVRAWVNTCLCVTRARVCVGKV